MSPPAAHHPTSSAHPSLRVRGGPSSAFRAAVEIQVPAQQTAASGTTRLAETGKAPVAVHPAQLQVLQAAVRCIRLRER